MRDKGRTVDSGKREERVNETCVLIEGTRGDSDGKAKGVNGKREKECDG